jgi:SAM-dependent methyltransferase
MQPVHGLGKKEIFDFAVRERAAGRYYDTGQPQLEEDFHGSLDRFCDIAIAFRNSRRVLDAASGNGLLPALLKMLGHDVHAIDIIDHRETELYRRHAIPFQVCNVEADPLPFADDSLDGVSCSQAMEHFTHSHLGPVVEMTRVLRPGGVLEIDVPNAASLRNRSRMLRGKHITWDYREHYLLARPLVYKGREYYPIRHNREFTKAELELLMKEVGYFDYQVRFLRDRRVREGAGKLQSAGSALRDALPALRKSLIAIGVKHPRGAAATA